MIWDEEMQTTCIHTMQHPRNEFRSRLSRLPTVVLSSVRSSAHVLPILALLSNYHNYSWRTGQLIYEAQAWGFSTSVKRSSNIFNGGEKRQLTLLLFDQLGLKVARLQQIRYCSIAIKKSCCNTKLCKKVLTLISSS